MNQATIYVSIHCQLPNESASPKSPLFVFRKVVKLGPDGSADIPAKTSVPFGVSGKQAPRHLLRVERTRLDESEQEVWYKGDCQLDTVHLVVRELLEFGWERAEPEENPKQEAPAVSQEVVMPLWVDKITETTWRGDLITETVWEDGTSRSRLEFGANQDGDRMVSFYGTKEAFNEASPAIASYMQGNAIPSPHDD